MQQQVHGGILTKNAPTFISMQGVYGDLAERVFDIDTAQHEAGNHAMALLEVHDPSTNIPEDLTKLTRWGSGENSIAIRLRIIPYLANVKS